jgi:hypothetical protein
MGNYLGNYLGNNMAPQRTRKNRQVWKKNPRDVGQPPLSAIMNKEPKAYCVILNVSGLAIMKKISVE